MPRFGVEVELVFVAQRRLVVVGPEQRFVLNCVRLEPFGEQFGVRPERVGIAHGDQRRREGGRDLVGDRPGCEERVVKEVALPEYAHMIALINRRPAGVLT